MQALDQAGHDVMRIHVHSAIERRKEILRVDNMVLAAKSSTRQPRTSPLPEVAMRAELDEENLVAAIGSA